MQATKVPKVIPKRGTKSKSAKKITAAQVTQDPSGERDDLPGAPPDEMEKEDFTDGNDTTTKLEELEEPVANQPAADRGDQQV